LNVEIIEALESVGWIYQRKIDATNTIKILVDDYGWKIFGAAQSFIESFDSLPTIKPPTIKCDALYFNCISGKDLSSVSSMWKEITGLRLFPIGHQDVYNLYID